ncbi:MAG TPA: SDR family oxidoreductase [Allosphingosinicella sp.]|jgi:NAD(P)-dependent dehydrogenase (short-subunit alcohol dehydrogenase family)
MPRVLITGAGRGIGLELARQYSADGWDVVATVREPARAAELEALGIRVEALDMRDLAALAAFPERLADEPLDLFIANAGVSKAKWVRSREDAEAWQEVHLVNSVAPTLLAEVLLPLVEAAGGRMAAISSRMGSIDDSSGGYVGYRASKAALNAAWRALALGWSDRPVTLVLLHPGWVQTDMGGAQAPLGVEASVAGMRRVIAGLSRSESGAFVDYRGEPIPW